MPSPPGTPVGSRTPRVHGHGPPGTPPASGAATPGGGATPPMRFVAGRGAPPPPPPRASPPTPPMHTPGARMPGTPGAVTPGGAVTPRGAATPGGAMTPGAHLSVNGASTPGAPLGAATPAAHSPPPAQTRVVPAAAARTAAAQAPAQAQAPAPAPLAPLARATFGGAPLKSAAVPAAPAANKAPWGAQLKKSAFAAPPPPAPIPAPAPAPPPAPAAPEPVAAAIAITPSAAPTREVIIESAQAAQPPPPPPPPTAAPAPALAPALAPAAAPPPPPPPIVPKSFVGGAYASTGRPESQSQLHEDARAPHQNHYQSAPVAPPVATHAGSGGGGYGGGTNNAHLGEPVLHSAAPPPPWAQQQQQSSASQYYQAPPPPWAQQQQASALQSSRGGGAGAGAATSSRGGAPVPPNRMSQQAQSSSQQQNGHGHGNGHGNATGNITPPLVLGSSSKKLSSMPPSSRGGEGGLASGGGGAVNNAAHSSRDVAASGQVTPQLVLAANSRPLRMLPSSASASSAPTLAPAKGSVSARSVLGGGGTRPRSKSPRTQALTPVALRALAAADTPPHSPKAELDAPAAAAASTISAEAIKSMTHAMAEAVAAVTASAVKQAQATAAAAAVPKDGGTGGASTPRMVIELSLNPSRAADNMTALRRARDALVTAQPELASRIGGDDFSGGLSHGHASSSVPPSNQHPFSSAADAYAAHHAAAEAAQVAAHVAAMQAASAASAAQAAAVSQAYYGGYAHPALYGQQQQQQQQQLQYGYGAPQQHQHQQHQYHAAAAVSPLYYSDGYGGGYYYDAPAEQVQPAPQPSLATMLSGGNPEVGALFEALTRQQQDLAAHENDAVANEERARSSDYLIDDLHDRVKSLENEKAATLKALVGIIGKDELLGRLRLYREAVAAGQAPPLLTQPLEDAWGAAAKQQHRQQPLQHQHQHQHQQYAPPPVPVVVTASLPAPSPQVAPLPPFQRTASPSSASSKRPAIVFGRAVSPRGGRALQQQQQRRAANNKAQPPPIIHINVPPMMGPSHIGGGGLGAPLPPAYAPMPAPSPYAPMPAPSPYAQQAPPPSSPYSDPAGAASSYMQQAAIYAAAQPAYGSYYLADALSGVAHTGTSALPPQIVPTGITQSRVDFYSSAAEAARRAVLSHMPARVHDPVLHVPPRGHSGGGAHNNFQGLPRAPDAQRAFAAAQAGRLAASLAVGAALQQGGWGEGGYGGRGMIPFSPRQLDYQGVISTQGASASTAVSGAAPAWESGDASRMAVQTLQAQLSAQAESVSREAAKAAAEREELDATWRSRLSANNAAWESSTAVLRGAAVPPAVTYSPASAPTPAPAPIPAPTPAPTAPINASVSRTPTVKISSVDSVSQRQQHQQHQQHSSSSRNNNNNAGPSHNAMEAAAAAHALPHPHSHSHSGDDSGHGHGLSPAPPPPQPHRSVSVEGALNRLMSLAKTSPERFQAMLQRKSPEVPANHHPHHQRHSFVDEAADPRERERDAVRGSVSEAINSALRDQMADELAGEMGEGDADEDARSQDSGGYPVSRQLLRAELALLDRELLQEALAAQQYGRAQGLTPAGSVTGGYASSIVGGGQRRVGTGAYGSGVYFAK